MSGLPGYYRPALRSEPAAPHRESPLPGAEAFGRGSAPGHDPVEAALLSQLDGSHTTEEILGALLVAGHPLGAILAAFRELDERGLLVEAPIAGGSLPAEEAARYRQQIAGFEALGGADGGRRAVAPGRSGWEGQARLRQSVVTLFGLGPAGQAFARALALAGVGRLLATAAGPAEREAMPPTLAADLSALNPQVRIDIVTEPEQIPAALQDVTPHLLVYCPERYDTSFAEWLNSVCLEVRVPLLLYRRYATEIEVGPLVLPGETACAVCVSLRRDAAAGGGPPMRELAGEDIPGVAFPLCTEILALEAVKTLARVGEPVTRARIWRYSLLTGLAEIHPVLKLPRCPACGSHRAQPPRKLWEEMA